MKKINYIDSSLYKVKEVPLEKRYKLKRDTEDKFYGTHILDFISVLEKDPDIDLNILYNNLDDLEFVRNHPSFIERKNRNYRRGIYTKASYSPDKKIIFFDDMTCSQDLYHEEFHVASSKFSFEDRVMLGGLEQFSLDGKIKLGKPLNEGYTELCVKRYFPDAESLNIFKPYLEEENIAAIIEEIVGLKMMKESYFNADLNLLINLLTDYETEENVLKFLSNYQIRKYGRINKKINYFLLKIYFQKLTDDYCTRKISYDELTSKLAKYFHSFGMQCLDNKCKDILGSSMTVSVLEQYETKYTKNHNILRSR